MKKIRIALHALLILTLFLTISSAAQTAKAPMTNDDVVQMLANGLAEDVVVESISANDVNFDVSPTGLLSLKKSNVPDKVVQAMLVAESKKREATAQRLGSGPQQQSHSPLTQSQGMFGGGMPVPNQQGGKGELQLPTVTLVVDNKRQPMEPSGTEVSSGKGKGGSAAGGILKGFGKGLAMAGNMGGVPIPSGSGSRGGIPKVGRTWALPGRNSGLIIQSLSPKFEMEFADIPGVDPDTYEPVLVKLIQTKDNWRIVSTTKDKFDKHGNDTRSDNIKSEDKVPLTVNLVARGHITVTPRSDLPPGEYGLILHPKKAEKEYAGITNANADAIFYSVWDFSVNADQVSVSGPASQSSTKAR